MKMFWGAVFLVAVVALVTRRRTSPARVRRHVGVSPLDAAERVLARRYVRGRINSDEYDRMTAVLRR